jgi:hypothetical protein
MENVFRAHNDAQKKFYCSVKKHEITMTCFQCFETEHHNPDGTFNIMRDQMKKLKEDKEK